MTAAAPAPAPAADDPVRLAAFIRSAPLGVVATVSPDGAPEAAAVGLAALDDGTVIFDTFLDSRKVANLAENPRIAVVVTRGAVSIQLEGIAGVTRGAVRERYAAAYAAQHPGSRVHDPSLAVVAVVPDWIRVYDASAADAVVAEAHPIGPMPDFG